MRPATAFTMPPRRDWRRSRTSAFPTVVLHGEADGVSPPGGSEGHARSFTDSYERRVIPVAGHFLPREAPEAVVAAVTELNRT